MTPKTNRFHRLEPARALGLVLAVLLLLPAAGPAAGSEPDTPGRGPAVTSSFLHGNLGALDTDLDRGKGAILFLRQFAGEHFHATGKEEYAVHRVSRDDLGYVHVRIRQKLHGLPVVGAQIVVHADDLTGEVYAVNGRFIPSTGLPHKASMAAFDALEIAAAEADIVGMALDEPELVYVLGSDDLPHLAWRNLVEYKGEQGQEIDDLFADAETGALVARHPKVHRAKSWLTYTANNGTSLPGTLRCSDTQTCGDSVLQNIHDGASLVYDYYSAKFGRKSYNGADVSIRSVGHYSVNYVNAFWSGAYLVYGDGDGTQSGPLGNAFDIVAHEYTHAVTDYESDLIYQGESGAINESLSDIFGAAAEAWQDGSINGSTWKLGEDTWTPGISGDALRYMNNPTQDGVSKDYYPERYTGSADNGGVHWNSGISNLAFYLLVNGGTHPRGKTTVNVTSIGLSRAEQIFYRAQTTYLTPSSDFLATRNATGQAALDLYGATYRDYVYTGWCAVGVGSCPTVNDNAQFISQSVPAAIAPGATATVSVTMKNTGTTTWTRTGGYKLGSQNPQDNFTWGIHRVQLSATDSIAPGQQKTFTFTITAPTTPGTYNFQWRMVHELVQSFGAFSPNQQIQVVAGLDDAQFILQMVPTTLTPGQKAQALVTMKNTGTTTWTRAEGYKLGSQNPRDNLTWGLHRVRLSATESIAPGQQKTFIFTITAPTTLGTYNFQWRMVHELVRWFGSFSTNRQIVVSTTQTE